MSAARVVVAVVGESATHAEVLASLEAAGALAEVCVEASAAELATRIDALVVEAGAAPEAHAAAAHLLRSAPSAIGLPALVVLARGISGERVAELGPAAIVCPSEGAAEIRPAVEALVERARGRSAIRLEATTLEDRLRAADRRTAALRAEGATLAHDARVLFDVIVGFGANLRDGIAGGLDDLQRKHVLSILAAAADANALIERHSSALVKLVLPSEDEAGSPPSSTGRTRALRGFNDVGRLVRDTTTMFEGVAAAKNQRLTHSTQALHAWCDAVFVKQAVVNLLANAVKYTPDGGAIHVTVRALDAGQHARPEVEITVSDNGPGVPVEARAKIFERGVRLERDHHAEGSGLGLAVVREVAVMHGGDVRVDHGPKGGATFIVTFPTDARTSRAAEKGARGGAP